MKGLEKSAKSDTKGMIFTIVLYAIGASSVPYVWMANLFGGGKELEWIIGFIAKTLCAILPVQIHVLKDKRCMRLELHIHTEYDQLLKRFAITEDFKQPFNIDDSAHIIDKYSDEIQQYKTKKQQHLHENDAGNMLWIEKSRGNNDHNIRDTKYYFVLSINQFRIYLYHDKNK